MKSPATASTPTAMMPHSAAMVTLRGVHLFVVLFVLPVCFDVCMVGYFYFVVY